MLRIVLVLLAACSSKPSSKPAPGTETKGLASGPRAPIVGNGTVCAASQWCWEQPATGGNDLFAAVAIARDDVWAVGAHGLILRFDGGAWHRVATPTTHDLMSVWAASASDIWIVGSDGGTSVILRGNRDGFRSVPLPTGVDTPALNGVAGSSADNVWLVGYGGSVLHWNGRALRVRELDTNHTLNAVAVRGPDDVLVVGDEGTVRHWNGKVWSTPGYATYDLNGIHGDLITGGESTILRFDGKKLERVHGSSDGFVLGAALQLGGTTWVPQTNYDRPARLEGSALRDVDELGGHRVTAFAGVAANDVWAIGEAGLIARWNGRRWSVVHDDTAPIEIAVGDELWGTDSTSIYHRAGDVWRRERETKYAHSLFVDGSRVWIADAGSLLHWNGNAWKTHDVLVDASIGAVWARSADDVWAVGDEGRVFHYTGSKWSSDQVAKANETLSTIWGIGSELWIAGSDVALHRDASGAWKRVAAPSDTITAIRGSAANALYAIASGTVLRWQDGAWVKFHSIENANLTAIHVISPTLLYVTDYSGYVHRWDGASWTVEDPGSGCELRAITGNPTTLWISGLCGAMYKTLAE